MMKLPSEANSIKDSEHGEAGAGTGAAQPLEESALLSQASTCPDNFALIYQRYFFRIYQYCLRRTQNVEEAEDLTSLVFIQALDKLPSFRGGSVAAWLFQIAHNMVINHLKKAQRHSRETIVFAEDAPPPYLSYLATDALEQLINQEDRQRLTRLVGNLPDKHKELLALRFAGGLSTREIGVVLNKSELTVRVSLHRIVQKLRKDYLKSENAAGA